MDTKEVTMIQGIEDLITFEHNEELKQFAEYLGVDYEDYLEFLHPDVDFDDETKSTFVELYDKIDAEFEQQEEI